MKCQKCKNHGKCELELEASVNHKVVCHSYAENTENTAERDDVNHPSHYDTGKYECIEVMIDIFGAEAVKTFCTLNAFKYLWRCKKKHKRPTKCLEKSRWYINKYLELDALPKTNADFVREMSVDELAGVLMCPHGDDTDMCVTNKDGTQNCNECWKRWLLSRASEVQE